MQTISSDLMQSLAAELRIALQLIGNRPYLLDNLPLGKSRGPLLLYSCPTTIQQNLENESYSRVCIQATLDRRPIHSGAYRMQINSASPPLAFHLTAMVVTMEPPPIYS